MSIKILLIAVIFLLSFSTTKAETIGYSSVGGTDTVCQTDVGAPFYSHLFVRSGNATTTSSTFVVNYIRVYLDYSVAPTTDVFLSATISDYTGRTLVSGSTYTYPRIAEGSRSNISPSELPGWITIELPNTTLTSGNTYLLTAACRKTGVSSGNTGYLYLKYDTSPASVQSVFTSPAAGLASTNPLSAISSATRSFSIYAFYTDKPTGKLKLKHRIIRILSGKLSII